MQILKIVAITQMPMAKSESSGRNSFFPSFGGAGGGFQPRTYRQQFSSERFRSFTVHYKETDLWIGMDPASFRESMKTEAERKVHELRIALEQYLLADPEFGKSFIPVKPKTTAPEIARMMAQAGRKAGTGPMAAVAGAFSEVVGRHLMQQFPINEIVVENGGDIFLKIEKPLVISVFAGNSPLSGKTGIEIPASDSPLGVCTSAGTVGPSVSFGKADAVMVVCKDTATADAYATAIGNRVKSASDIETALQIQNTHPEIRSLIIICEGQLGIKGAYPLKLIAGNL